MSLSKTVLFIIDGTSILNLFLFCRVTFVCQRMSSRVHSCIVPDAIVSRPRCGRFSSRVRRQVLVAVVVVRLSKVGRFSIMSMRKRGRQGIRRGSQQNHDMSSNAVCRQKKRVGDKHL